MNSHVRRAAQAACVLVSLGLALICGNAFNSRVLDRLSSHDLAASKSLVVVGFDSANIGSTSSYGAVSSLLGHRIRDLVIDAQRAGASAVLLVGFDSATLTDGGQGKEALTSSPEIGALAILPLHDVQLRTTPDGLPAVTRYRVDELAAAFAGTSLPLELVTTGTLRVVPLVAAVPALSAGAAADNGPVVVSSSDYAEAIASSALRAVSATAGDQLSTITATGSVMVGDQRVPLESGGLRINWSTSLNDTRDASVVSAGAVLFGGNIDSLAGKIVIAGPVDPQRSETFDTPVGRMTETMVQANIANTLLSRAFLTPMSRWYEVIATLLLLLLVVGVWQRSPRIATVLGVALGVGWLFASRSLEAHGRLLPPLGPPVGITALLLLLTTVHLIGRARERSLLAALFGQYVPPTVARRLIEGGRAAGADVGERVVVSVLFCDLRGFTPLSAQITAPMLRQLLDDYYERLSVIVFRFKGSVLQYTGDEIFAAFGAPEPITDHARAAFDCAEAMFGALSELNASLGRAGLPPVNFGIGLHTGSVVAANVGSAQRRQFTLIGETVNIASRFCSLAREGQIAFSGDVRTANNEDRETRDLGPIELKGVTRSIVAYCSQRGPVATSGSAELIEATAHSES